MSTLSKMDVAPSNEFIPLSIPEIRGNEWNYVKQCLDTGWVSSVGSFVDRFEAEFASYVNVNHAVATVNGTAALHIALLVAGVQPEDEVLVSTLTFIAPVNAIHYVGAYPVFIDAEPIYWQIDTTLVIEFLEDKCVWANNELRNKITGRRVKAIIPVHILGHPVDIDPILDIAHKYKLVVIEDATESLGAKYKNQIVGSLGDIACFSFNGNKIITTGGGGMIVTSNKEWAKEAKYLTTQAKDNPVEYIHNNIGYNYRLTNIQAAIGCAQLELLDSYITQKREIASKYNQAFTDIFNIILMKEAEWADSIYWMYTILIDNKHHNIDSRMLMEIFQKYNIQTRPLWQPIHLNKPYQHNQICVGKVAVQLYHQALSLPCSVGLRDDQQDYIVNVLRNILHV